MTRPLSHIRHLVAAVLLALSGVALLAPPAQADEIPSQTALSTPLFGCAKASCTTDSQRLPAGLSVTSFCTENDAATGLDFDLIYTGPLNGRGGFVPTVALSNQSQSSACNDEGVVSIAQNRTPLHACASGNCRKLGETSFNNPVGVFCSLNGQVVNGNRVWYLIYSDITGNAGFASATRLVPVQGISSCNA